MGLPEQRDFDDDEPATAVMHDDLVAELTARTRDDELAPLPDAPTKVAKISVAELFAAAGMPGDAPAAAAPAPGLRLPWRRAAVIVLAAAFVATLAIIVVQSFATK